MLPKISIITVCFNETKEKIVSTFESICSQSYDNTEWIVVDGGSKPDTIEAIDAYSDRIDKFISESDNGIYDAMNKGVSLASGDFVIFMNVGDKFHQAHTIATVADRIVANLAYDCFFGDVLVIDGNGKEWASPQIRRVSRLTLRYSMVCHQAIFSRRTLYDTVGGFDLSYRIIADRDWVLRAVDAGAKWLFVNEFICYYDGNGISSDIPKRHIEADRFVSGNYGLAENFVCFYMRKYRNLKQRSQRMLGCRYKGLPILLSGTV